MIIDGFNPVRFGSPYFFTVFTPQIYHTRILQVFLNDEPLSNYVVSLNGTDTESGQNFVLSFANALELASLFADASDADVMQVVTAYRDNRSGSVVSGEVILTGSIDKIGFSEGGRSKSLVVYCRGEAQPRPQLIQHHVSGVEYYTLSDQGQSIRLPARMDIRIGDRVIFSGGELIVRRISYTIDSMGAVMTISG